MLQLLRSSSSAGIVEMAKALSVTKTAIRQRLSRLMAAGLVERTLAPTSKPGRPCHRYSLTEKGRRRTGTNFADLTIALWREVRAITDPQIRKGLFDRLAKHLAAPLAAEVCGTTVDERMESVAAAMRERELPFSVEKHGQLPVLSASSCPYPGLAEQDRGICAVERLMFGELLGSPLRLGECRLDGGACCRFETQ